MPQQPNKPDGKRDDRKKKSSDSRQRRRPRGKRPESKSKRPPKKRPDSTRRQQQEKKKPQRRDRRPPRGAKKQPSKRRKRTYCLVVNQLAGRNPGQPLKLARRLERRLKRRGHECNLQSAQTWDEFVQAATQAVKQRPYATVVFGGDGSVRLAASKIARSKGLMGIVPCGRFNNIFSSLYGHGDQDKAIDLVCANTTTRIDAGLANGTFFLGSLITGLVPNMIDKLGTKKLPRLAMTWGKLAGRAADETMPQTASLKIDAYSFQVQPLILHIQLLPNIMTLPFAPVARPDDGHVALIFDRDGTRDVVSHYIRDLRKDKYQYIDGIQMLRGERVTVTPAAGRIWLMDGDKIEFAGEKIGIEILHRILRVFTDAPSKNK